MTRLTCLFPAFLAVLCSWAQPKGDEALRLQADALFQQEQFADAMPLYAQLVSLSPGDHDLNYRLGTCVIHSGEDKESAIGFLTYAVQNANIPPLAWYYLGRAYHLTYRFKDALDAYQHFRGTEDKKALATHPVDPLEKQCRNGLNLLNNLKEVTVHNKVEVADADFFRYYDLSSIGGRIVVTPEELMSSLDKKSKEPNLIYLPDKGGHIYFSSYGKDGKTGRDIYSTSLLPEGKFEEPLKLAGYINTDQDEGFAFLAPDGKTFYFASKGHNSMGGYDVFKSSYDPGLDVYGPPVNLDFAVNTPSDDIFYLVDPEGKEACFASGRDSRQGMIHVYRVSTAQQPITITVLKGTYASTIDVSDRSAHITVEDAVTHEQVADVSTDINGTYTLSLPRNGRYKFKVEAGPSGRVHVGIVDVPRSDSPRAYRQELTLVNDGGEKLVIRNYFDEPLPDDLIALALDEIKRRAKLDVGTAAVVAEVPPEPEVVTDVLTAAGFTGDVTKEAAVGMARKDAEDLARETEGLRYMSGSAFSEAVASLSDAERASTEAKDLVVRANAATDDTERNDLMVKAADARQRSRLAVLQARAAYRTGQDLDAQEDQAQQRSIAADKLGDDLEAAISRNDDASALSLLKELKARLDEKNRPDGHVAPEEQARRAAVAKEQEASKALASASRERDEENQLIDQVNSLKREREATKGKARRDQLDKEIVEYQQYQGAKHEEVEQAFSKARALENETAIARAQASLMRHLAVSGGNAPSTELDPEQLTSLEQKIAATDETIAALPIDERFDAMISAEQPIAQRTEFEWDLAATAAGDRSATEVLSRDAGQEAETAEARRTAIDRAASDAALAAGTQVPEVGISHDAPVGDTRMADANGGQDTRPNDGGGQRPATGTDAVGSAGDAAVPTTGVVLVSGDRTTTNDQTQTMSELPLTPEDPQYAGKGVASATGRTVEETRFLKENELAEARQLREAARNKSHRDSLDARIASLEQDIAAATTSMESVAQAQEDAAMPEVGPEARTMDNEVEATGVALAFDTTSTEEEVIKGIFESYAEDRQRIDAITSEEEHAAALNGLELMLVDSISAQTSAQLAELEKRPDQAAAILPRVDRLRLMKESHLRAADVAMASARREQVEPAVTIEDERLVSAQGAIPMPEQRDADEVADRYVAVDPDPQYIYDSKLQYRSEEVTEAAKQFQMDLEQMYDLEDEIDSLESVLDGMPQGKAYDKLREKTDRKIDDRMIMRMEMGQRTEFISREEWKAGQDSLNAVREAVVMEGLAPSEPLMVMARQMEADSRQQFDQAMALRKRADRIEDIVMRDSLFRHAYAVELEALHELDRAITVNNYMLSEHFAKGDHPDYETLEAQLFGVTTQPTAASTGDEMAGTSGQTVVPGIQAPVDHRAPGSERVTLLYGDYLDNDQQPAPYMTDADPEMLALRAQQAKARAREMEVRSEELGDRALALNDSASSARRKDREELEMRSLRTQQMSDSIFRASVVMSDSARMYEMKARDAEEAREYARALDRYYYLSGEERVLVMNEADHSRYFQVRVHAMDQQLQAAQLRHEAAAARQLAQALTAQSQALMVASNEGPPSAEARAKSQQLDIRVAQLNVRADSLESAAARLADAGKLNEAQAALILEGMDPQKSSEVMALEQGARRTEPFLAQAHSLAGEGIVDVNAMISEAERTSRAKEEMNAALVAQPPGERMDAGVSNVDNRLAENDDSEKPPASTAPISAPPAGSGVFVAPDVLTRDIFEIRGAGDPPPSAIGVDQRKPQGLVFSVQIGAFRNPIPADLFEDFIPVMGESAGNGLTRYTAGLFNDYTAANKAKNTVRDRGYRDAFVVAYRDGKRITLAEAMRATEGGEDIVSRPVFQPLASDTTTIARNTDPEPVFIKRPAEAPSTTGGEVDDSAVLANYPATAVEIVGQFKPAPEAATYYDDPNAAPARQVETVKGLFFTVQVGVYSKPTALDRLFNITPLNSERTETGKIRYTTGIFLDTEKARIRKDATVVLGVKDAFVTAYLNGRRIPIHDARALLQKHGAAILADPSIATH